MIKLILPVSLLLSAMPLAAQEQPSPTPSETSEIRKPPKSIAKELASGDGMTQQTAIVIYSNGEGEGVGKEYEILQYLGLRPGSQSLIVDQKSGKPFDMIEATDPKTGATRQVWFDISKFFGKF